MSIVVEIVSTKTAHYWRIKSGNGVVAQGAPKRSERSARQELSALVVALRTDDWPVIRVR